MGRRPDEGAPGAGRGRPQRGSRHRQRPLDGDALVPGAAKIEEEAAVLVVPGARLRSLRHAERLRLTDVARPGVSAPTVHRWETGRVADPSVQGGLPASAGEAAGGAPR
ncbi:helix-turn-helix domain-containing protein [Streptomyces griseoviridis]